MTHNEPSQDKPNRRENTMRSIILVAAVIAAAIFLAPKVTAMEMENPFASEDTNRCSAEFDAPRITSVTVRGVEPTFDDGGRHGQNYWNRR